MLLTIAAIQETKWFGQDVWIAEGYTSRIQGGPCPLVRTSML